MWSALPATAAILSSLALVQGAPTIQARSIEDEVVSATTNLSSLAQAYHISSTDYAPYKTSCPSNITWVRSATEGISSSEKAYLEQRAQASSIDSLLSKLNLTVSRRPTLGVALSGGGYRAMTVGLGGLMGLMDSSSSAESAGTGGWMDGVSYLAGLSGGSWATAAFTAYNGALPSSLVDELDLDSNLVIPKDHTLSIYAKIVTNVYAKRNAGFPTQITDFWSLALGEHILPEEYRVRQKPSLPISSLPSAISGLSTGNLPMPILIAAEREQGEIVIAENATIYEATPYEFGAWSFGADNKVPGAFTPIEYLGTPLSNGNASGSCYKGFDQLSFFAGTSSTLFNAAFLELKGSTITTIFIKATEAFLNAIGASDVSSIPNPFRGWTSTATPSNPISDFEYLTLVDAGETEQNVPLEPLLVPQRAVDAIIAFDNSADTSYNWPNGSALWTTYQRAIQLNKQQNVPLSMPAVPSVNGFINGGLNTRPTFFGCNDTSTPIVIYVPNYPWKMMSNISTFTLDISDVNTQDILTNGQTGITLDGSLDTWPKCLGCALTDRANDYTAANRTTECEECFSTFCWNGVDDSSEPSEYAPAIGTPAFVQNLINKSNSTSTNSTSS